MQINHSSNPTLRAFEKPAEWSALGGVRGGTNAEAMARPATMTLGGTIAKTAYLVALCAISAILTWTAMTRGLFGFEVSPILALAGGGIGGFVLAIVMFFSQKSATFLATPYAVCEGAFLSGFSLIVAAQISQGSEAGVSSEAMGMIFQAVLLTFAIAAGMLIAYGSGLVKGGKVFTGIFMTGFFGLIGYIAVLFIGNGLFGANIPNLYSSNSPIGIGFTAICLVLASMMLVLDFRLIESGVKAGAPKYMEWYGGYAVLATLVWIYIEVLRLLMKLRSSD